MELGDLTKEMSQRQHCNPASCDILFGISSMLQTYLRLQWTLPTLPLISANSPPLSTSTLTSLPTGRSLRMSTTWEWLNVWTFCLLISLMTSPFSRPRHHWASRIIFTFWPRGQSAMAKPKPPGPFTKGTPTSSGCNRVGSGPSWLGAWGRCWWRWWWWWRPPLVMGGTAAVCLGRVPPSGTVWWGSSGVEVEGEGEVSLDVARPPEASSLLLESSGRG